MIIGHFKKNDDHSFKGAVHTLTLNLEITLQPIADRKGENAPDYRITTGDTEIGAAWKKSSEAGNAYLSVSLDDPALPSPVSCALVKTSVSHGYSLVWERKRKKANASTAEF